MFQCERWSGHSKEQRKGTMMLQQTSVRDYIPVYRFITVEGKSTLGSFENDILQRAFNVNSELQGE